MPNRKPGPNRIKRGPPGVPGAAGGPPGPTGPTGATGAAGADGADATGDVVGPASAVANHLAVFNGTSGKLLKDGGAPGVGAGDVVGPASAVNNHLTVFDGTTGKLVKDGGAPATGDVVGPGAAVDNHLAVFDGTTGKLVKDGGAPGAGAGLVLLEQHTAANSATLDFTTAISATYDEYLIEFLNIIPVTGSAELRLRMSTDGGATYDATNFYSNDLFVFRAGGSATGGNTNQAQMGLTYGGASTTGIGTTAAFGLTGNLRLFAPLDAALYTQVHGMVHYYDSEPFRLGLMVVGAFEVAVAVNALRFYVSSGNIASGAIRVYGVAK